MQIFLSNINDKILAKVLGDAKFDYLLHLSMLFVGNSPEYF